MKMVKVSCVVLALLGLGAGMSRAVDTAQPAGKLDLTAARAKVDAKDFPGAIGLLTPMLAKAQDPELYNLLGFSYRKSGDLKQAATFYQKALDADPNYKPTLEYQGEMFLLSGDVEGAKKNLAKLASLCPSGCDERSDLEKAIATGAPVQ